MNSIDVDTNAAGVATAPAFIANTILGNYVVTASSPGIQSVNFKFTNTAGPPFSIVAKSGFGQTTVAGAPFGKVLTALVSDSFGNPVPNYPVIFSAPAAPAPGATFAGMPTATVKTNNSGIATSPAVTANAVPGTYSITAAVVPLVPTQGVPLPASFTKMTNTVGPPAFIAVVPAAPGDPTFKNGTYYATTRNPFSALAVKITDAAGNPVGGLQVQFKSTTSGAGGTFAGPSATVPIIDKPTTGANGVATADPLTANATIGSFEVTVTVPNTKLQTSFDLTNKGQVAVPAVAGLTQAAAATALNKGFLNVGAVTMQSSKVPAGNVISSTPAVGAQLNVGSAVALVVSKGP
jgi:hypothetical protein